MKFIVVKIFLLIVAFEETICDVYLHNPRGSNNRWNENGRGRNNANRLFNSENNNRGGYNVGSVSYYVGSKLRIEWTNQHSCGDQNNHCDIILQYMCGNLVRDGTTTTTIPYNPTNCKNLDCNEDRRYGMHEDFYSYAHCKLRSRNLGLFTANQNVGPSATQTRQNRNGNRYGYECTEERDYYPYWGPTRWRDIAVLTNDVSRCPLYLTESQNVKEKWACEVGITYLYQKSQSNPSKKIPITKEECESFTYMENGESKNGTWTRYPSHGISAPDCAASLESRDNHLGNTLGGQTANYNWTIPNHVNGHCTLRIRYNISTTDFDRDNTSEEYNNRIRRQGNGVDVWTNQGLSESDGVNRGYKLVNDPVVDVFGLGDKLKLRLALDTAQYGRTFQDRSHTFSILPRPADIPDTAEIHNINVRGKRGNIVQVYPGVEYDFVPNTAEMTNGDYVHFQWTGSDNNPGNNDGQGRASTDRSNVVLLNDPVYVEGEPEVYQTNTYGKLGASYPRHLSGASLAGLSSDDLARLATLENNQFRGDMVELDDAGTYYDLGPRKVTMTGTFHYMCTRNNNFSNRSQKGKILVTNSRMSQKRVDQNGGKVEVQDDEDTSVASLEVPPAALTAPVSIEVRQLSSEDVSLASNPPNTDYISEVVAVSPAKQLSDSASIKVEIKLKEDITSLYEASVYRSNADATSWEKLTVEKHEGGKIITSTDRGGHFVISKSVAAGAMAGLVIGLLALVLLTVGLVVMYRKNKSSFKDKV